MSDKNISRGPGLDITTLRCNNINCRVETFTGTATVPFTTCPMCQVVGVRL